MARLRRLAVAGEPHYLIQRSVHGQPLVVDEVDRQALIDALREALRSQGVALWAYAVLDHEIHLLAVPPTADALGRMMQMLGRRYVAAFNRRHRRTGALWEGRFRAAVVEPGEWLLQALTLIDSLAHERPVWSSAPHHLGQRRDPLLDDPPDLWALGNTPFERDMGFRACLARGVPTDAREKIVRAVQGAWAVGSPGFVAKVTATAGRPAAPRPRGRPRRQAG